MNSDMVVERFARRARESVGDLAARVKALGDEGLVNLVSRDHGWELALAVIRAIASENRLLARAAAVNLAAADLVYRWARCDNLRLLEPIVRGRGIAALAHGPESIKLNTESGQLSLSGYRGRVPLLPIAETVIVVAASRDGVAAIALAINEPAIVIQTSKPGTDDLPTGSLILDRIPILRRHLVGTNPLPPSEPEELRRRLGEALTTSE